MHRALALLPSAEHAQDAHSHSHNPCGRVIGRDHCRRSSHNTAYAARTRAAWAVHAYMLSISSAYFSCTTGRFSFSVGPSSPPVTLKSTGMISHFLIVAARDTAFSFARAIPDSMYSRNFGSAFASSIVLASEPMRAASVSASPNRSLPVGCPYASRLALNDTSATRYGLRSPTATTFCSAGHSALIASSIGTGAMFSPPAVISSSLRRPVMRR
mmetsp:Transcript_63983/g.176859  ORF Transcript_63983/g.176859 Transcript_63983/m.176859 type:complete len:214 (-) Transcript_63983:392-1033(-)